MKRGIKIPIKNENVKEEEKLKKILKRFSNLEYDEVIKIGLTAEDLTGVYEIVPNKEYEIRLTKGIRQKKKIKGTLLKAVAEKKALIKSIAKQEDPLQKKVALNRNATVIDAVMNYTAYRLKIAETSDKLDPNTVYWYYNTLCNHIVPYFGENMKIHLLNKEKVESFLIFMRTKMRIDGKGLLSKKSVEDAFLGFSVLIKYCYYIARPRMVTQDFTKVLDFSSYVPARKSEKEREKAHTLEELFQLQHTLNKYGSVRLKAAFYLMLEVGCRREECCGFKWKHINLETGELQYGKAITSTVSKTFALLFGLDIGGKRAKALKTENSDRLNYLSETALTYLKQYKKFKESQGCKITEEDYIFTNWENNDVLSPQQLYRDLTGFTKKYDLVYCAPHDFRHTLVTRLLEEGVPLDDIADYIGDTKIVTKKHYDSTRRKNSQRISKIVDKMYNQQFNSKEIELDVICKILNNNIDNSNKFKIYEILDFITQKENNSDTLDCSIEIARDYLLHQNPELENLCNENEVLVNKQLETLKKFGFTTIEVVKDQQLLESVEKIYKSLNI